VQISEQHRRARSPADQTAGSAGLGFGSLPTARRTLAGYEAMAMVSKGQVQNIGGYDMQSQTAFVASLFQPAA
jgi:IS6 family transposase